MVRFVLGKDSRSHIGQQELNQVSWLSLIDRVRYFRLTHVFKITQGRAPSYLADSFTRVDAIHSHDTRDSGFNFYLPSNRSGIMAKTFLHSAVKDWNALPSDIKKISSEQVFKSRLKEFLAQGATL